MKVSSSRKVVIRAGAGPIEVSAQLLVRHGAAFECAWSLYNAYGDTGMSSVYVLPMLDEGAIRDGLPAFRREVKEWFQKRGGGDICLVRFYQTEDDSWVACTRGETVRVVARFVDSRVEVELFQPAAEETLVHDSARETLCIKGENPTVRRFYLETAVRCFQARNGLFACAADSPALSLEPLERGFLRRPTCEDIVSVSVKELVVVDHGASGQKLTMKSDNALRDLRQWQAIGSRATSRIHQARLGFELTVDRKTVNCTVTIRPPHDTDLPNSPYREVIEPYLLKQGIVLR